MKCTYAQQSTPLVGLNTDITSLENKDNTQSLFGSPKIEKMKNTKILKIWKNEKMMNKLKIFENFRLWKA